MTNDVWQIRAGGGVGIYLYKAHKLKKSLNNDINNNNNEDINRNNNPIKADINMNKFDQLDTNQTSYTATFDYSTWAPGIYDLLLICSDGTNVYSYQGKIQKN